MMNNFKIGDSVSVLDEAVNGIVIEINKNQVTIESTDGFVLTFFIHELIKNDQLLPLDFNSKTFSNYQKEEEKKKSNPYGWASKNKNRMGVPEFDLHIEKLVPRIGRMSNYEILALQTETAKRHIEFAIKNRIPKIVFIHGIGEGILKAELDFILGRYDNLTFQEANYQKYGGGATEVYFKQNSK